MRWKGRRVSTNVEDRRGGGGAKAGGINLSSMKNIHFFSIFLNVGLLGFKQ